MKYNMLLGLVCVGWFAMNVEAQPTQPAGPQAADQEANRPGTNPTTHPAGIVTLKDVRVDLKGRTVIVDTTVCKADYGLEFLLCHGNDKSYESLLSTGARASDIHAALLMLGLTPGLAATWTGGEDGKFLPPRGPELTLTARWKDKDGNARQADVATWLTSAAGGHKAAPPKKWIFVGSDLLGGGGYAADREGGIICVANQPWAVIDVPFESTQSLEQREFSPDKATLPPAGTPVELVLTPLPGADKADYARILLEIDRFGNMEIEGKNVAPQDLSAWAQKYIDVHAKGQVVIRAAAGALAYDAELAKEELGAGGVKDIVTQVLPPMRAMLPRSPQRAQQMLQWWDDQFRNARELIADPAQEAQRTLGQIDPQIRELDRQKELWEQYRRELEQALTKYKSSTQPAKE